MCAYDRLHVILSAADGRLQMTCGEASSLRTEAKTFLRKLTKETPLPEAETAAIQGSETLDLFTSGG